MRWLWNFSIGLDGTVDGFRGSRWILSSGEIAACGQLNSAQGEGNGDRPENCPG